MCFSLFDVCIIFNLEIAKINNIALYSLSVASLSTIGSSAVAVVGFAMILAAIKKNTYVQTVFHDLICPCNSTINRRRVVDSSYLFSVYKTRSLLKKALS